MLWGMLCAQWGSRWPGSKPLARVGGGVGCARLLEGGLASGWGGYVRLLLLWVVKVEPKVRAER